MSRYAVFTTEVLILYDIVIYAQFQLTPFSSIHILAGYIDGSHLIGVTDSGKVFFLNLLKDSAGAGAFADSGHCGVDVSGSGLLDHGTDLEGIAIDHDNWSDPNSNMKYAYMVHEGNSGDAATLYKIAYEYNPQGSCSVNVIKSVSLFGSTPCLGSNGIESLTWKETIGDVAYFYAAVQDTGKIYEITSEGTSNGCEYNGGLGMITDISASSYDGKYVWSFYGHKDIIVVVDPVNDCTLDTYDFPDASDTTDFPFGQDKEGLIIDVDNGMMYVAIDNGSSNAGAVAAFNFTAPNLGACRRLRRRRATGLLAQASCTTTFDACTCDHLTKGQCNGQSSSCSQEGNGNKGKCISSQLPGSTTTTATQVSPTTTIATVSTATRSSTTAATASSTTAACASKGTSCDGDDECCGKCKGKVGYQTCN